MDNLNVLTDAVLAGITFVILMVIRQQVHSKIVARVPFRRRDARAVTMSFDSLEANPHGASSCIHISFRIHVRVVPTRYAFKQSSSTPALRDNICAGRRQLMREVNT